MGQTVLEMIGIKKSFSGIYALSGIDFSLELGEVHALLGENGAGKSTLIKVLGGIYQPDSGIIKVNGKEVKINGVPAARENGIGIIHQEIVLVPYLSVAQNLFLGREIRTKLVPSPPFDCPPFSNNNHISLPILNQKVSYIK